MLEAEGIRMYTRGCKLSWSFETYQGLLLEP
jgi:hypothetical protein